MAKLSINTDPRVKDKFNSYPKHIKVKMKALRKLIIDTAKEIDSIAEIEETLKWGEPSYLVKKGSTLRMDWKEKNPNQYAMYFKCTSKLVVTFRALFGSDFNYEKNRAIVFNLDEEIPETRLKKCIAAALQYHLVKDKPNLAIEK